MVGGEEMCPLAATLEQPADLLFLYRVHTRSYRPLRASRCVHRDRRRLESRGALVASRAG